MLLALAMSPAPAGVGVGGQPTTWEDIFFILALVAVGMGGMGYIFVRLWLDDRKRK